MRGMGVPARLVTGYQGGERNPVDGYWTVRNADAHAWTEVWLQGEGWVRIDPTGAVAPGRIGQFQRLSAPPGAFASAVGNFVDTGTLEKLRAVWEAVNNRWNQWVLNYSQGKQLDLLRQLGMSAPDWTDLAYLLAGLFSSVSLIAALWAWWERRQHDPWLLAYARIVRTLNRAGADAAETWPPLTLAHYLHQHLGLAAQGLMTALRELDAQRYGPQIGRASCRERV